jgi:hypothetical protein
LGAAAALETLSKIGLETVGVLWRNKRREAIADFPWLGYYMGHDGLNAIDD